MSTYTRGARASAQTPLSTPSSASEMRATRRGSLAARLSRGALFVALLLVVLAESVYLLRGPLLEAAVCRRLEAELGGLLDARVEIDGLRGNWLTQVTVEGVRIDGRPGAGLIHANLRRLDLRLRPWRLARGDLSGLEMLVAELDELHVDPMGRWPSGDEDAPTPRRIDPWQWFDGGVEVQVSRWALGSSAGADAHVRRGTNARIEIPPGSGRRQASWADRSSGRTSALVALGSRRGFRLYGSLADPASWARAMGWDPGVTEGTLRIAAQGSLDGDSLAADLQLAGLSAGTRPLPATRARLRRVKGGLHLDDATLSLPGIEARVDHASIPLDDVLAGSETSALERIEGAFDLRWRDLDALADLLPDDITALGAIAGQARGRIYGGQLTLDALEAGGAGIRLRGEPYRGPLPLWKTGQGDPMASFRPRPWAATLTWDADIAVPFVPELALGPGQAGVSWDDGQWSVDGATDVLRGFGIVADSLRLDADWDGTRLRIRELRAGRFSPQGAGSAARLWAQGEARFGADSVQASIRARGTLDSPWWPMLGYPDGSTSIAPLGFEGDATATFELGAGEAEGAGSRGALPETATLNLDLRDVGWCSVPPLDLHIEASLADGEIQLAELAADGWLRLRASGSLGVAGDWADAQASLRGDWAVDAVPDAWLADADAKAMGVRGRGSFAATGPMGSLTVETAGTAQSDDPTELWRAATSTSAEFLWPSDILGPPPTGALRLDWGLAGRAGGDGLTLASLDLVSAQWGGIDEASHANLLARGTEATAGFDGVVDLVVGGSGPPGQDLPLAVDAHARCTSERVAIERLTCRTGIGTLEGAAALDADLPALLASVDAPCRGDVTWRGIALETLPEAWLGRIAVRGATDGSITLAGTLGTPELEGRVSLRDGALVLPGMGRIDDLEGAVSIDARTLRVERLAGSMGEGPVALEGTVTAGADAWWRQQRQEAPWSADLHVTSTEALFVQRSDLRLRATADVRVQGTAADLAVHGDVEITSSRLARRMTLLPDLADLGSLRFGAVGAANRGVVLFSIEPPLGDALHFDLDLHTSSPLELRTHVADTDANLDLRLSGTGALPYLVGTIQANTGRLRFPGSQMDIESVLISFSESDPLVPRINATAAGRRYGYRTALTASGTYDNPDVVLSTQPALPPADAWTLVTTGLPPAQLQSRNSVGQATLIGGYLIEELAGLYLGGPGLEGDTLSFIERFTFEAGREVGRDGEESITVEFEVTDEWALQAERDVYGDYNGGVVLRLRFR